MKSAKYWLSFLSCLTSFSSIQAMFRLANIVLLKENKNIVLNNSCLKLISPDKKNATNFYFKRDTQEKLTIEHKVQYGAYSYMPLSMLACSAEEPFHSTDKKAAYITLYIKKVVSYVEGRNSRRNNKFEANFIFKN